MRWRGVGASYAVDVLRAPDDPEGFGDPVDDVADLEAPEGGRVANEEEDGVSLPPHGRAFEARDDGRLFTCPVGAAERYEPDHRHDARQFVIAGHRSGRAPVHAPCQGWNK